NLPLTGSVANAIAVERTEDVGPLSFREYCQVRRPITVVTLAFGSAWLWLIDRARGHRGRRRSERCIRVETPSLRLWYPPRPSCYRQRPSWPLLTTEEWNLDGGVGGASRSSNRENPRVLILVGVAVSAFVVTNVDAFIVMTALFATSSRNVAGIMIG